VAEAQEVSDRAEDVVQSAPLRALGRIGLVAYGVVNLMIAGLAVQIAFGDSEQADKAGALAAIASTGVGVVVLWVIALALAALVVWQLADAVWGHRGVPAGKRVLRTAINLAEATVFAVLAQTAVKTALASGSSPPKRPATAAVFELPGGRYLVGLAGVGVLALTAYAVYRGITAKFLRELDLRGAGLRRSVLVTRIGRVGWTGLGLAYATVGVMLLVAAVRHDPAQPAGLDAGFSALGAQPFGRVLLVVLALGLAVFGVYCFFDARYRKA